LYLSHSILISRKNFNWGIPIFPSLKNHKFMSRAHQTRRSGRNSRPISAEVILPRLKSEIKVVFLEFRHYKFRSLLWFFSNFCINKLIHLYSLNKPFSLILMYFHMNYNCFVDEFYHKTKKVCKKGATCKENKTTLISLLSRGRMTSADIGREFRPLLLVWWALLINLWFFKDDEDEDPATRRRKKKM
jgi:hypothetical protein